MALAEARPRTTRHELLADRRLNFPRRKREVETSEEQVYGIWDMGYGDRIKMKMKIKELFQGKAEKIEGVIDKQKTKHRIIYEIGV